MKAVRSTYFLAIEKIAMILLLLYPLLMLTVRGGMNAAFLLMLLLTAAVSLVQPLGINKIVWRCEWTTYLAAMAGLSIAILISQLFNHSLSARPYDAASRYWLAIPVFFLLQRLELKTFIPLQFAFPIAAIAGLMLTQNIAGNRLGIGTLDLIHFGDFELILGMLSLISLNWFGRDSLPMKILKVAGFCAGLAASIVSGSRGGWLMIPVFIVMFLYFRTNKLSWRTMLASLMASLILIGLLYTLNDKIYQRANELIHDVMVFDQGQRDTSTGLRWQLYQAAVDVIFRHPIIGVGPEGFAREMQPMMEAGKLTPIAADLGRGEVHSDILSKTAGMGIFGLVAMLAIYIVPLKLFWLAHRSASEQVRRSAQMGIVFVSGCFVFGLTVECLNLTLATAFYSFTVAVLLAASYNIHDGERVAQRIKHEA